jgi:hypothetical protein
MLFEEGDLSPMLLQVSPIDRCPGSRLRLGKEIMEVRLFGSAACFGNQAKGVLHELRGMNQPNVFTASADELSELLNLPL